MIYSGYFEWSISKRDSDHIRAIGANLEYIHVPSIVTHLSGRSERYCRVGFTLETEKNKSDFLFKREYINLIQDSISSVVSSYTPDGLQTHEGKIRLKRHIRSTLNSKLPQTAIYDVYFREFVME